MAQSALRIGIVGLDTSHSVAFTKCLNKVDDPEHVGGGRVTVAFPGGSPDFDLSISRVPGYRKTLEEDYGVKIVGSPADVAGECDIVVIGSCDGRVHRKQFEETVGYHRPTFIDKPIAVTSADARAIFDLAARENVPVMSCSALRYAENLVHALNHPGDNGAILGVDVFGPMAEQETQPGLFWYGIHCVEVVQRVMGRGCKQVRATKNADGEVIACVYADGRMASIRGIRGKGHHKFGAVIQREKGYQFVDISGGKRSYYAGMLETMMATLPLRKSDVRPEDTLEVVRVIEAANESRRTGNAVEVG
jgi:predicted dehydrogenase